MFSREYYEAEFTAYPDVVTLKEMRKMVGGTIGDERFRFVA